MNGQPVLSGAAVLAVVNAFLVCLVAFGVSLSPEQTAAVMGLANAVIGLVIGFVVRGKVSPAE
jgi:hypothetical protein